MMIDDDDLMVFMLVTSFFSSHTIHTCSISFNHINFFFRCRDQIHIITYLKEPLVTYESNSDFVLCAENQTIFTSNKNSIHPNINLINNDDDDKIGKNENVNEPKQKKISKDTNQNVSTKAKILQRNEIPTKETFQVSSQSIYSVGNIIAIRLVYEKRENIPNDYFSVNGSFRFLDKCK